jgi:hypothetical protein
MFTSWSEVSTPAELSMKSVLMAPPWPSPPDSAYSIRPRWVRPRLPPSPTQRVGDDGGLEALGQLGGEVGHQVDVAVGVVGQVGVDQPVGQHDLGPGQQHRELRCGEALAAVDPPAYGAW